nr:hypothetical protein [Tanacetum cinerariifolium]
MKSSGLLLVFFSLLAASSFEIKAQTCKPSVRIRGKKPPAGQCNRENDSDCCVQGKLYTTYTCSPPVTGGTEATLTLNSFQKGGDGGGPSECHKYITINGNGRSVKAMVVDECDSTMGCDAEHDYQPPCPNNIVDASKAVWKALGVKGIALGCSKRIGDGNSTRFWLDIWKGEKPFREVYPRLFALERDEEIHVAVKLASLIDSFRRPV